MNVALYQVQVTYSDGARSYSCWQDEAAALKRARAAMVHPGTSVCIYPIPDGKETND